MWARQLAGPHPYGCGAENPIWHNAYLSAANESRHGAPKGDKNHQVLRDVLKDMIPILLMKSLSIRLSGPRAAGRSFVINWSIASRGESCHTELSNEMLNNCDTVDATATLTVKLPQQC